MDKNNVIEKIKSIAQTTMPKGSVIWLFGSRVRGDYTEDSDWDILVLLDKENISNQDYDQYAYPITYLGWEIGENISPIIYSKKQWRSYSFTPFYKNVEHDKLPIYES